MGLLIKRLRKIIGSAMPTKKGTLLAQIASGIKNLVLFPQKEKGCKRFVPIKFTNQEDKAMNQCTNQRVCIVTGGNSGVGLMSAVGLAQLGYHVFLACRCVTKAEKAVNYIRSSTGNLNVEFLPLDLASLDSVRTFVQLFQQRNLPLHLLVNNAGVFNARGITKEGFELIFGINYLGHFLLTNLLLETLRHSAPSRIIMVSSDLALRPTSLKWESFVQKTPLNFLELYALSKLCLLILTQELTRRLENTHVTVNAIHPGFVQSNITLGHRLSKYLGLGISPQQSALGLLTCATSSAWASAKGKFFDHEQNEIELPALAQDPQVARQLWERSCLWTGLNRYNENLFYSQTNLCIVRFAILVVKFV